MSLPNYKNANPAAPSGCTNIDWQAAAIPSPLVITAVSDNAGACQITLASDHTMVDDDAGFIDSPQFTAIAGRFVVTVVDALNLVLQGSVYSAGYVDGAAVFNPYRDISAYMPLMLGDGTGSPPLDGGVSGAVPAPPPGSAAAGMFLRADATWAVPAGGGVNLQTTNYAAQASDSGQLISFDSGSAVTLTLPATPPFATWWISVQNVGAGTLTILRNGNNIDGAPGDLTLIQSQGIVISTDGTNYETQRGMGLQGTVTHSDGTLSNNMPVFGNGGGDIFVGSKTGNSTELVTYGVTSPPTTPTDGYYLVFDVDGNAIPSAPLNWVTNAASLSDNMPVIGQGSGAVAVGTKTGNTNNFVTAGTGTPSVGDLLGYDIYGNAVPTAPVAFKVGGSTLSSQSTLNLAAGTGISLTDSGGGTITIAATGGGTGTVTSVSASVPSFLTVAVSNSTTTPAIAITATSESANLFLASPNGSSGAMTPRAIAAADLPLATTSAFGAVKPDGTTIDVSSGVISVPTATTSALGLVKPDGATIDIAAGVISVPTATVSLLGLVEPDGVTITIDAGVISAVTPGSGAGSGSVTSVSASVPAFLTVSVTNATSTPAIAITATSESANLFLASPNGSSGAMTPRAIAAADLPLATTSAFGAVKPDGATIDVTAGVISVPTATTSLLGLVEPDGSSIVVSSGVITSQFAQDGAHTITKPPASGTWTWVPLSQTTNGSASLSTFSNSGSVYLDNPTDSTNSHWRMVYQTLAGGNYTLTACLNGLLMSTSAGFGIFVGASTTSNWAATHAYTTANSITDTNGNIQACTTNGTSGAAHPTWNTTVGGTTADGSGSLVWTNQGMASVIFATNINDYRVKYQTNYVTNSSTPVSIGVNLTYPQVWLRIQDNGTNLIFSVATFNTDWIQVYSISRTTFLSGQATIAGFCLISDSSYPSTVTLSSWGVTYP